MIFRWVVTLAAATAGSPAVACMLCHSTVAEQVRAALFAANFWSNFAAVAAPIPLLAGAVLLVARSR